MHERDAREQALTQRSMTVVSIAAAAGLVTLKLGVGIASRSLGLLSSGIESSGDVIAAVLTFFAVRLGGRPADAEHPYGHRRAENLGALGEAAILLAGGLLVGAAALRHLIEGAKPPQIYWLQFAVLGLALLVDLSRTIVSLRGARRFASAALRSNAFHFATDMLGTFMVLAGLLLVRAGVAQADALAALVVAAMTVAAAGRLIAENANVLMDRASAEASAAAERAIAQLGGDIELSRLRLRESSGRYFADVVASVPAGAAMVEGHEAASMIEAALHAALPGSDVVVHVEPRRRGLELRDRVLAIALAEPLVLEAHDVAIFEQDGGIDVSLHLKFPADLDLRSADAVSARVERSIRAQPGVATVQTHLEPLERPLSARPADVAEDARTRAEVRRVLRARTGRDPERLKLLATEEGPVLFVTLAVAAGTTLSAAHELAGELEDELRRELPGIADVVIHTEP